MRGFSLKSFMAKKTPKNSSNQKDALTVVVPTPAMKNDLQVVQNILSHNQADSLPSATDPLTQYVREISRYKLLTPEEEETLLKELQETGDIDVAKKLVLANLRLVVKIAIEYRSAWQNVMDLIQEGNIVLMKAVSK